MHRAYVEGKWRAITAAREIRRDRNKGRIEVQVRQPVQSGSTWEMRTRKRIVSKEAIYNARKLTKPDTTC